MAKLTQYPSITDTATIWYNGCYQPFANASTWEGTSFAFYSTPYTEGYTTEAEAKAAAEALAKGGPVLVSAWHWAKQADGSYSAEKVREIRY